MSSIDLRSNQIRTNKIISSGSTGTNAKLLVYDVSNASNNSGSINTSTFNTSSIGTDIFCYISGTISAQTSPKIAVFGGDLVVSGSVTGLGGFTGVRSNFSGSVYTNPINIDPVSFALFTSGTITGSNAVANSLNNGDFTVGCSGYFLTASIVKGIRCILSGIPGTVTASLWDVNGTEVATATTSSNLQIGVFDIIFATPYVVTSTHQRYYFSIYNGQKFLLKTLGSPAVTLPTFPFPAGQGLVWESWGNNHANHAFPNSVNTTQNYLVSPIIQYYTQSISVS